MAQTSPSILLHHSFTTSMSKQLFLQGAPVVLQRCYSRGELLWHVAGYRTGTCRGAVLQTEQYSGGGLGIVGWGWGCRSSGVGLFCSSHSSELLHAADTGNDYNYRLEERRDGAVSRVVCSVLFFVLLRHVMLLCPPDTYKTRSVL